MAAITLTSTPGRFTRLLAAQTGTTTSWVSTPGYPCVAIVYVLGTVAGTNWILTLKEANPAIAAVAALDDTHAATIFTSATVTATGLHSYLLDPRATAVADAAGAPTASIVPMMVPAVLGVTVTPTGSTYSTAVEFRRLT